MKSVKNLIIDTFRGRTASKKNARDYYHRQRLERLRKDVESWRNAVRAAEQVHLPQRADMMSIFQDTILNGHVIACLNKRRDLTLLKDYALYVGDEIDENSTQLIQNKQFKKILKFCLDARFWGYTLVNIGDIIDGKISSVRVVPREYINPDNKQILPMPYGAIGVKWTESELNDWLIYADTDSDTGSTDCGFGLLYPVSYYEILLRNLTGYNADYLEIFGQPLRVGTTSKVGEALDEFEAGIRDMASSGYLIKDATDDVEFLTAMGSSSGQGHLGYDNFETRLEKKISKIILGHADAIDSTTGKLGADQGEDSSVNQALRAVEEIDNDYLESIVNDEVLPKLRNLGIAIPEDVVFGYVNDHEEEKQKNAKNGKRKVISEYVEKMSRAGYSMDEAEISEEMGLTVTKQEPSQTTEF